VSGRRPPYFIFEGDFIMTIFKRLFLATTFLALYFSACHEGGTGKPSTPDTPDKTYLKITNNTPYAVNVYINAPPLYGEQVADTIRTVPSKGENRWELLPSTEGSNGETLYFEYLIPIGNVTFPHYPKGTDEGVKQVRLEKGVDNTVVLNELPPINADSSFVLVQNNTTESILMLRGVGTILPYGAKARDIVANGDGLYVLSDSSLSGYTIGTTVTRKNFPNTTLQKGVVYTFLYDSQNGPQLFAQNHFDPSMNDKIWTIPTSIETGRYFTVGLLQSRKNVETDGYILAGRVNYSADMASHDQVGATPYLGAITPDGNVVERKIILRSNPSALNLKSFIDKGELVFTGQAYYGDANGAPFILGTDYTGEPLFYLDDFLKEIDVENESKTGVYVAEDKSGKYAIGGNLYNYNTNTTQAYLDKVTRTGLDSAIYERLWIQPSDDCRPVRNGNDYDSILFLAYDDAADSYIVVADDKSVNVNTQISSLVYIVNATDGTQKPVIKLADYTINTIFKTGDGYYAAGTYYGVSKYRGFIRKLNIEGGTWDGDPKFVDSKYLDGATRIYNIIQDKDGSRIILSGACVKDAARDKDNRLADLPWMVKYDLNAGSKIWERVYENRLGYYIHSAHPGSMGNYLLELYNNTTYQSTLVSTDLLGEIGGQEKPAVPRGSQFAVSAPGSPGVSAVLSPFVDAEMQETAVLTLAKGASATIQVEGQWASYQWYVNGASVGNETTYTFTTATRNPGVYTVTAVVTDANGAKRSASRQVRVTN
jgi:hypothetical protein